MKKKIENAADIMRQMAMKTNHPICGKKQFGSYCYHSKCTPMDEEWKTRISNHFWATGYKGTVSEEESCLLVLRDRLLEFDGEEVCFAFREPDLHDIMQYGQLWIGEDHIKMRQEEPNACHSNVCYLYERFKRSWSPDRIFRIATGYALSKDGMWRQHSWLIEKIGSTYQVIETTEPRELYFGFCMTEERAKKFCLENFAVGY